jgi:hypothetical protein
MQYIVTKQFAVEAETPEEAAYKSKTEGQVMSLSVNPRPQPMQPQPTQSEALKKQQEKK